MRHNPKPFHHQQGGSQKESPQRDLEKGEPDPERKTREGQKGLRNLDNKGTSTVREVSSRRKRIRVHKSTPTI